MCFLYNDTQPLCPPSCLTNRHSISLTNSTPSPLPMPEIPYLPFLELDTNISLVKFLPRSLEGSDLVVSDKKIVIGENVVTNLYVSSFYYI